MAKDPALRRHRLGPASSTPAPAAAYPYPLTRTRRLEDVTEETRALTPDEERSIAEAQVRLDAHLAEVEKAYVEGRLADLIRDTPSIQDQLQPFLDTPA